MALTRTEISKRYALKHPDKIKERFKAWYYRDAESRRKRRRDLRHAVLGSTKESLGASSVRRARKWEKKVAKHLSAIDMNARALGQPFDLLLGDIKLDLKIAENNRWCWNFKTAGQAKCDFYLLLCLVNNRLKKAYLLPARIKNTYGISIGRKSLKYAQYEVSVPLSKRQIKSLCQANSQLSQISRLPCLLR